MVINFDLFKVSKMTSLKTHISSVMEKHQTSNLLETSNFISKTHSKGSIGYSASNGSEVITS